MVGFAGIAREAGVGHGVGCQLFEVFRHQTVAGMRDLHIGGQLAHGGDGRVGGSFRAHTRNVDAHGARHVDQALGAHRLVELHGNRQQHGARHAMRRVVMRRQRVRHGVVDAQTDVGEAHACNILAKRRALAAGARLARLRLGVRRAQILRDQLDSLQVEHVGQLPSALRGVALDGVRERVHTRGRGQARRHAGHHVGIDHRNVGNIVDVDAHELAHLFRVGDDIVDGDLGRRARRGGNGDGERGVVLRGRYTLERNHVGELGVLRDDADALGGIHGRAAADRHDHVRAGSLERRHAVLHVLDGWVGLDLVVKLPRDAGLVKLSCHLARDAESHQIRVGAHERLREAAARDLAGNLPDRAGAVIRDVVEHETIDRHGGTPFT